MVLAWARVAGRCACGALGVVVALGCESVIGADEFGTESPSSAAGAGGGTVGADADGGGGGGSLDRFSCRREIRIDSTVDVDGYTLVIELDHAALVAAGKSRSSGDDVRVFRELSPGYGVELPRTASRRTPWGSEVVELAVRLPELSEEGNPGYVLVYGGDEPTAPPDDPADVYDLWDDFEGTALDSAWLAEAVGAQAAGSAASAQGELVLTAHGTTLEAETDSFFFVHRELSRDFVAETVVLSESGNGSAALLGGLMARPSTAAAAPFAAISFRKQDQGRAWLGWRSSAGDSVSGQLGAEALGALPVYLQLRRLGNSVRGAAAREGEPFVEVGQAALGSEFPEPFRIGIPFANLDDSLETELRVGWFSARSVPRPEPDSSLGPEQCR